MRKFKLATLALACACLAGVARADDPAPPAADAAQPAECELGGDHTQAVPVWRYLEGTPGDHLFVPSGDVTASAAFAFAPRSDYWVGIGCVPLSPQVRAHVDVPEGQGLVVHGVAPESPAAEAGIEQYDILLSYDDAPVGSLADLVEAVDARGAEETTLTLIRGGEQTTVTLTPVEREEDSVPTADILPAMPFGAAGTPAEGPFQFQLIHPPTITLTPAMAVPEGVQIQITKNGQEPAEIRVTRGEETWEVTEDDLSPLPEDLRPAIQSMLRPRPVAAAAQAASGRPLTLRIEGAPGEGRTVQVVPAPRVHAIPLQPAQASQLDESVRFQLEQIQRQLNELRRTLEAAAAE